MRCGIRNTKRAKGFTILLFTLVVLLAATVASFISASSVVTRQHTILSSFQQKTAFHTAQAGLDYSIPYLTNNYDTVTDGHSVIINLSNGNYFHLIFSFIGTKDLIRVESTGYAGDGSGSHKIEHVVHYTAGAVNITSTYAVQSRGDLEMSNNTDISDLSGNIYTVKLGGGITMDNSASTTLDSGVASTRGAIGDDVMQNDADIASSTDSELELSFLGAPFSDFQNETPILTLPAQIGDYDYQDDISGMSGTSILITHSGGRANFEGHSSLGTIVDPAVLTVNLDGVPGSDFFIGNNTDVNAKIVVNNGPLVVDNSAIINGSLIVQGDLTLGNNVVVNGDIIITGNLLMNNNAVVNGAVFALGNVDLNNDVEVNGAIMSGGEVDMDNNVQVTYDPDNASITVPGETGVAGYGKVSGSWTDMSAP